MPWRSSPSAPSPSRPLSSAPTGSSSSSPRCTPGSGCRRCRPRSVRDVLYGAGLAGPVLALVAIGTQLGLGLHAPLYVVSLMTLGFIPWTTRALVAALGAFAAARDAVSARSGGRYAADARRRREAVAQVVRTF